MAQEKQLKEIFGSAWGITEGRREEIENGHAGAFDRIFNEEINRHFYSVAGAAVDLKYCPQVAGKKLAKSEVRYILHGGGAALP